MAEGGKKGSVLKNELVVASHERIFVFCLHAATASAARSESHKGPAVLFVSFFCLCCLEG